MIPRFAQEYRAMVADLARTLTEVNIQRAQADVRKLVGEIRVEATEETIGLWSAQSADPALARVAGGSQPKDVVVGGGIVRSHTANLRAAAYDLWRADCVRR